MSSDKKHIEFLEKQIEDYKYLAQEWRNLYKKTEKDFSELIEKMHLLLKERIK